MLEAESGHAVNSRLPVSRLPITARALAEVWPPYVNARKSKWNTGHIQNHMTLAAMGGEKKKRGKGLTVAGPMASIMPLALADLTARFAAHVARKD